MVGETGRLALMGGLTAPCDVCGGIKVSYVNDIEISMLSLRRHLQMRQMFEGKQSHRAATDEYFERSV